MNKKRFYEPRELVKLGIIFSDKYDAYDFVEDLSEKLAIAIGKVISGLLTEAELEEFDQLTDEDAAGVFLEEHCPSYKDLVEITMNQFCEKTKKERLTVPNAVSLAKDDLNKVSVDLLFLGSKTTGLLKAAGFKTIADIILRFNSPRLDFLQKEEGEELFEMAVMLRYYQKEDKKQLVYERINSSISDPEDEERSSSNREETPVTVLNLPSHFFKILSRGGVTTVEKLLQMSDEDLIHTLHISKVKLGFIRDSLAEYINKQNGNITGKKRDTDTSFDKANRKSKADFFEWDCEKQEHQNAMALLEELIGLQEVKLQVQKVAAYAMLKKNAPFAVRSKLSMALNMTFVGNPGTAKTTVARILAGIFYENGLLSSGELVEVGRADLVAKYTGQTAIKVQEVFRRSRGKMLFIDEAYALVEDDGFSDEAIATIVQEMENHREDTIVIIAGYPDKMKEFLSTNPGLKSRIPFCIEFKDYSAEELLKITELEATRRGFSISDDAKKELLPVLAVSNAKPDGGNGRLCRNVVESAILNYSYRNYGDNKKASVKNDFILIPEDFGTSSDSENNRETSSVSWKSPEKEQISKDGDSLPDYLKNWETIWTAAKKLA